MDPIANLKEQLALARAIQARFDECPDDGNLVQQAMDAIADDAQRLSELVLALDEWMRKGGFSPWR
jgi:hypothetical protein